MANETAQRVAAMTHGTTDGSAEQSPAPAQGNMEDLIQANQALIDSISEISRTWIVCWQEQFAEGMKLAGEVLERQGAFVGSTLERLNAQAAQSAELSSNMVDSCFALLRESADKAAKQTTRPAA